WAQYSHQRRTGSWTDMGTQSTVSHFLPGSRWRRSTRWRSRGAFERIWVAGYACRGQQPAMGSGRMALRSAGKYGHLVGKLAGQAIWRYHPETQIFEIFAEGGGNTFNLEFDSQGRIYSGDNGYGRGPYFKQGAYYEKAWGKHGPLTNPYAFGFLPDMSFEGEKSRFTHASHRYEGNQLPERFTGNFIALNPLQGNVMLTEASQNGSTISTKDLGIILNTEDRWFRPIDIQTGPDGMVYITDWYDSRLSHVDP